MALKNTNTNAEYPYVQLLRLTVQQRQLDNNTQAPEYSLSMKWIYYKVENDGTIVYDNSSLFTYDDPDFYQTAVADLMVHSENAHVNTLGGMELSVQRIVEQISGNTYQVE